MDVLELVQSGAGLSPGVVACWMVWVHRRVARLERDRWPEVFGGDPK